LNSAALELDARESSDLTELIGKLWAGKLWILGSGLLLALLSGVVAFKMTPIYQSSTILVPANPERSSLSGSLGSALGSLGGLASLADIKLGSSGTNAVEALAVLRSRQFTDKFIADRQLMQIFFSELWDSGQHRWNVPANEQPTAAKAYTFFDRAVRSVTQDTKTGLVTLQIKWKDPHMAADWANELVQRLNQEMQGRAISQAGASLNFLEKELARTNIVETRSAINRLVEQQINQRMLANVTEQFAFRVVDRAMPADRDDVVRPKKLLMVVAGGCLGGLIGCVLVLFLGDRRSAKASR